MKLVEIGSGNVVMASRVICVAASDSAPIRRMITEARESGMLVDCCSGKKCRSVIVLDSDHVITSALEVAKVREEIEA